MNIMDDEYQQDDEETEIESEQFNIVPLHEDEQIVRWVALALIDGRKETEIRNEVNSMRISSQPSRQGWTSLIRRGREEAEGMRSFILAKAEMGSVDYLRLDSYTRRKRMMARMEGLIECAVAQSDSVSKLNSTSFMLGGLLKAQESMDKFTGAQEAAPQVQINIGYDPLEQFRGVIQLESQSNIINGKTLDVPFMFSNEEE